MWEKFISIIMAIVVSFLTFIGVYPEKPGGGDEPSTGVTEPGEVDPEEQIQKDVGILGFAWDEIDGVFYSTNDPWQRYFGYNEYYDVAAQLIILYYDTVRIKFTYDDKDWMVQLWKGQYGLVLIGAEAGVYYKNVGDSVEHYQCVDDKDRLGIGYTIYSYDDVLFTRTYQPTWWLTGFVGGKIDKFADRSQLSMKARITLKDAEMTKAFTDALQREGVGFTKGNAKDKDTFFTSGNDVYFMWNADRNKTS